MLTRARIPNALTLLRLVLAAAFFALLSLWPLVRPANPVDPWLIGAGVLFIVAAMTDALDGYLARKWGVISVFGRIMDPFADKVLILGAFAYLASPLFAAPVPDGALRYQASGVTAWMVVLVLARELLVTSIRGAFESRGVDFSASASGKWKMILQSVAVPLVLFILAFDPAAPGSPARWVIDLTVWATVIVTVWSGVPYVLRAIRTLPPPPSPEEPGERAPGERAPGERAPGETAARDPQ